MSNSKKHAIASLLLAAGLGFGIASPAFSQASAAETTSATSADTGSSKAAVKAQRKADRKAHRARKNAELSKLEKNGYNPSSNDPNYPDDLQKAEKKANGQ